MTLLDNIRVKFLPNNARTANVIRNTLFSAVLKISTLVCSLLIVPITIGYLNKENYGIWMAMSSILYWFAFFDVGLGNGMRNYLSQALSNNNYAKARSYFSTAMVMLSAIAIILGLIAIPVISCLNLNDLFNARHVDGNILTVALIVAVIFSLLQFVVKNIGMVYIAMQKYAVNDFIGFLGNVFSVLLIYIFTKTTEPHLLYVVVAFTSMPVLFFILASIPLLHQYPWLTPSIKCIDIDTAKQIVFKGLGFFVIQITSCLFIFGSANLFLSHYCGPEQVTVYNVSYKFFNVLIIVFTILISPLWNAYTDAAIKGEYQWIRKTFKKSLLLWALSVVGGIIALALSSWFFKLWVGDKVHIPFAVSACVLAYVCMFNLNNCATYLINGLNKIRIQILTSVIFTIIYLLSVFMMKGKYGILGISSSMMITYFLMAIIHLYQCYLLSNNKAKGIWNK